MPTPRPDKRLTVSAVEKPVSRIMAYSAESDISVSATNKPRSIALLRIASLFKPRPSSIIFNTTSEPSRCTTIRTVPSSDFFALRRSAGNSKPCAMELRSICSSGAVMRSSTLRSISPEAPSTFNCTCLPVSEAACRNTRRKRGTKASNGTIRVRIKPSCRSELTRACCNNKVSY